MSLRTKYLTVLLLSIYSAPTFIYTLNKLFQYFIHVFSIVLLIEITYFNFLNIYYPSVFVS